MPSPYSGQSPSLCPASRLSGNSSSRSTYSPLFLEESSLPWIGGSDGVSVLDLLSSTNDVREAGSSKLTSGGVAVPASFRATADLVLGKFPSNEPTMYSLMVSTNRFTASVTFFVIGDNNNVVSTCFSAPVQTDLLGECAQKVWLPFPLLNLLVQRASVVSGDQGLPMIGFLAEQSTCHAGLLSMVRQCHEMGISPSSCSDSSVASFSQA